MNIRVIHLLTLSLGIFSGFVSAATTKEGEVRGAEATTKSSVSFRAKGFAPSSPAMTCRSFGSTDFDSTDDEGGAFLAAHEVSPPRRVLSPVVEAGRESATSSDGDTPTGTLNDPPALHRTFPKLDLTKLASSSDGGPASARTLGHSQSSTTLPSTTPTPRDGFTPRDGESGPLRLISGRAISHWEDSRFGAFHIIVSTAVLNAVLTAQKSGDLSDYFVELKQRVGSGSCIFKLVEIVEACFDFDSWCFARKDLFPELLKTVELPSLNYLVRSQDDSLRIPELITGITWLYAELISTVDGVAGDADDCHYGHSYIYQRRYALPLAALVIALSQHFQSLLADVSFAEFWASFYNFVMALPAHKDVRDPNKHDSTLWVYETKDGIHHCFDTIWAQFRFEPVNGCCEIVRALNSRQLAFGARIAETVLGKNYLYDVSGAPPTVGQINNDEIVLMPKNLASFSDAMVPVPNCEIL